MSDYAGPPGVNRTGTGGSTKPAERKSSISSLFSRKSSSKLVEEPAPMKIEFRVVFRDNGVACDAFSKYTPASLHIALQQALPDTMTGTLLPSVDSKGQPAVLVRAHARDINTMYELRSQVVSGDFMNGLTRALRSQIKSERYSVRQEMSKRGETPGSGAVPAKDEDLDKMDMGATDMTVYDDDSVWEKIRLFLPWQEEADNTKATKKELSLARKELKEGRARVAELKARVDELTERLAAESKPPDDSEEIKAQQAAKEAEASKVGAIPEDEPMEEPTEENPTPAAPRRMADGVVAANHISLEELTEKQWDMVKKLKESYLAAGGELDDYGDIFILRFLIDKDWKFNSAEKKAKSTAAWRSKVGANAMRKAIANGQNYCDIPKIKDLFTCVAVANALTRTKTGDLLTIIDYGSLNVDPFFKKLNNAEYFDINTYILEYVSYHGDKLTKESGALVRQAIVVDAGGIGLSHVSLRMFIRFKPIMPLADLYYPELLGCARVLNAAWALHQGWKLVKPLLSKQIQDMVGILDSSKTAGALLKIAEPDVVPDYLGGTAKKIERPALDWYPKQGMPGVDADHICPGKKLGKWMRATLAPDSTQIAGLPDNAAKGTKASKA